MQQFLFAHPARLQKKLSYFMPLALEEKSHPGVRDGCDSLDDVVIACGKVWPSVNERWSNHETE